MIDTYCVANRAMKPIF